MTYLVSRLPQLGSGRRTTDACLGPGLNAKKIAAMPRARMPSSISLPLSLTYAAALSDGRVATEMISTIAIGTDGSATADKAVDVGREMARRFDAEVVLLSVFRDSPPSTSDETQWAFNPDARLRELLSRTERRLEREGIECTTLIGEGDPAKTLVQLAEQCDADVLVIGNKGMNRRVLGSVPNSVAHNAPCSVLVVKTS